MELLLAFIDQHFSTSENWIPRRCRRSRRLVSEKAAPGVSTPPLWHTAIILTHRLHKSSNPVEITSNTGLHKGQKLINYCYKLYLMYCALSARLSLSADLSPCTGCYKLILLTLYGGPAAAVR